MITDGVQSVRCELSCGYTLLSNAAIACCCLVAWASSKRKSLHREKWSTFDDIIGTGWY